MLHRHVSEKLVAVEALGHDSRRMRMDRLAAVCTIPALQFIFHLLHLYRDTLRDRPPLDHSVFQGNAASWTQLFHSYPLDPVCFSLRD
jgi:hypothetical protein